MSKKRNTLFIFILSIFCFLISCQSKSTHKIIIRGSTTVLPILQHIVELYKKKNPHVSFNISPGGSGVGISSVANGTADIGMASREITQQELNQFESFMPTIITIAKDAVICAVSKSVFNSGITSISKEEIARIYKGEIKNWKELNGMDHTIFVIDKEISRGTRHVFMNFVFGNKTEKAPAAMAVSGSNNEAQTLLSTSDAAIGMLSLPWLNDKIHAMAILIDTNKIIAPSLQSVKNGSYPLSRNLNIIVNSKNKTQTLKKFIQFIQSQEVKHIIEESGFVSVL